MYHKKDTKVGSQNLATKFGFVPDCDGAGTSANTVMTFLCIIYIILMAQNKTAVTPSIADALELLCVIYINPITVYPKKYAHGFCFAVLCCGYTLTDFPISIRLTSPALWQSNDCPNASKVTLMNMDKYFLWIHYERLHNHNKAKHNKTVCIFLGIYCTYAME